MISIDLFSIVIGVLITWFLNNLNNIRKYIKNLFLKKIIEKTWNEYHVTRDENGEFYLASGTIEVKRGFTNEFNVIVHVSGMKSIKARGRVYDERDFWVFHLEDKKSEESFTLRLYKPIPRNGAYLWGFWLGISYPPAKLISGPMLLSESKLSMNEAKELLFSKVSVNNEWMALSTSS
jgi:hypothetical protein